MIKTWYRYSDSPVRSDYLSINGYGVQEPMPTCTVERPAGTGDYLLMLFFDEVDVAVGEEVQRVTPGTFMAWKPGSNQRYGNERAGFVHSWIHLDGALVKHLVTACDIVLDSPVSGVDRDRFEHHLSSIHFECTQPIPPDRRIVENVVSNLIFDIHRSTRQPSARAIPPELLRTRAFIDTHFSEPVSLAQLARLANLSPQHFCSRFSKSFGVSPISYLLRVRMGQAAYLLLDRNTRVADVARRVGIDDVHYFSRLFKRFHGKSPRDMRQRANAACA
jgi:AraC-like DNA-binding protein